MTTTAPRPSATAPESGARPASTAGRLAWLDNVRVGLTVLVLAHHAAVTYSHIPLWPYHEPPRDGSAIALDALVGTNQMWFMGLFFLISGFFVPDGVDRHGVAGFVRGRLLRLGVPFLVFLVVLAPVFRYPGYAASPSAAEMSFPAYLVAFPDPGPLWFVAVLLVFSLVYATVRALRGRRDVADRPGRTPGVLVVLGLGLALGVVTWVWRIGTPDGTYWAAVGLPSPSYLPQYAAAFTLGVLAARRQWLQTLRVRTAWACVPVLVVALGVTLAGVVVIGPAAAGGGTPESLVTSVSGSLVAASAMTIVLVLFRTVLDRSGRVPRFLSAQAFAVYVLHAPVLVWLGVALAGLDAPAVVKAFVLLLAGAAVTWSLAWALRRIPGVARVF
ncbi:fucose 4-O-acetylase-like acetyltransferase [Pseudonocardia sediminis]|uniref:Fucose 4-O-acetylase-like acetyltransferase n=1 Tax=Pseudonocardia sediminis TaxID=1397368 RepID=A0A4Q7UZM9_PSEST|nr:acyltransferase [Pseudonocardia sediminis]RZT86604.1 fucose 4-O-acetylase-like acetyltransferase [Pseudonocardia sediminis]